MKILKKSFVFSQDFFPSSAMGREGYLKKLEEMIRGTDLPSTLVLTGRPGTGKTLIGRIILRDLNEFKGAYVNCYIHPSDRSIIAEIIGDQRGNVPYLGNVASEDLHKLLYKKLSGNNNLIILDEVHSIKRFQGQIIYMLTRSTELGGPGIKLLLLSLEEPEMYLDNSTLSGLGRYNRFSLKEYDEDELYEILRARALDGFYEGSYSDSAIRRVSELSEESGSARVALELLKNSALLAESKDSILDEDKVTEAYRDFSPPLEDSSLINLDQAEIELLRGLLGQLGPSGKFKSSELRSVGINWPDSRLYKFLKALEVSGLVKKSKIGKGFGGGVENEYMLKVPQTVLLAKLSLIEKSVESSEKER